jgi:nucleotide-binding universal stress UspA family protein
MEEFYATYDLTEFQNYKDSIPPLHDLIKSEGYEHLDVKHAMEEGETIETILRVAKENECDLIVMGTTGAKGLKELFMGSVAGEILENAHCPVLVVPDSSTFDGKIDQIAFTTSYKEEEKKALQKLTEIAADFDAEIHCINVDIAHTSELTNQMAAFKADVQGYDKMTFEVLEGNDVKKAIFDYLAANPIDIIAMVTHKRNFFEELFNFSKTKRLVYHSKTPLLAIPAELLG